MDIERYLRQQRNHIGNRFKEVKDFSVFDFSYIPDKPILREECRTLADEMLRFDISGIANHHAIVGSRGSGKTLMVKYLQQVMVRHADLDVVYANCRHHNSSFKVLAHWLNVPPRGFGLAELFQRFSEQCHKKTVVVLDEIDLMSPKDRRKEILYLLSRSEQPFMVLMLSNSPQVIKELDAATRSSLQPIPLHFKNYDAQQIQAILRDRATHGLHRWDEGMLAEIAALTVRLTNSDARVGIKTLQYTVTKPELDLRTCFDQARRDLIIDLVNDLSDATLMILRAVTTAKVDLAKGVYDRYRQYCHAHHEKPFSYMHFYSHLSYLQSVGLVALVSTKTGRAYTNRVLPTFDTNVVGEICRLRFGA